MAQLPNLPQEMGSIQVLLRFGLRMVILLVFAGFGSVGFGGGLTALLWMAAIFSAVVGAFRCEPMFDKVLNHCDEMMAYAAQCCLVSGLNHAAPSSSGNPTILCGSYEIAIPSRSNSYPAGKILPA